MSLCDKKGKIMKNEASCQHEVIVPNRGLPFKLFLFEGKDGKYIRDKHWHRSVEIFAVKNGSLNFFLNEKNIIYRREILFWSTAMKYILSMHRIQMRRSSCRFRLAALPVTIRRNSSSGFPTVRRVTMRESFLY